MSSHAPPGKHNAGLPPKLPTAQSAGGGFVSRYKLQQQRIRTLNQMDGSAADLQKRIQKSLPKIQSGEPEKENLVIRAVQRSNTMDAIKLPGVGSRSTTQAPLSHKRKSLPLKTYHLRVNPDHASFISKSLPSLPSIPGSPSYPEDQAVSPMTERVSDRDKTKVPVYVSKHRFEKIVFQKRLHRESTDWLKHSIKVDGANDTNASSKQTTGHTKGGHGDFGHISGHGRGDQDKPHTTGSVRIRYSKAPKDVVISETQSEPSFEINRKWKENCRCLRCQMLKRQFQEGDSHYGLWGRYPCHHVDPTVMLDD